MLNLFPPTITCTPPPKKKCSDFYRGYRKRPMAGNWLMFPKYIVVVDTHQGVRTVNFQKSCVRNKRMTPFLMALNV